MNELKELKEIIQEAWNEGNNLKDGDTFGSFLDRAANAIHEAGYRKIEGKPPVLNDEEIETTSWKVYPDTTNIPDITRRLRAIAQAQRDADVRYYTGE